MRTITERGTRRPTEAIASPERLAVLGRVDGLGRGADQLDLELGQHAGPLELHGEVERRLAAQRRQQRVGALAAQHAGHALEVERLEVRRVGPVGVGHDRGRVRVDEHRAVALLAQHLERLHARVVELAGLADHDRAGADDRDRVEIVAARHQRAPPCPRGAGLDELGQLLARVVRPGRGLGVELHAPDGAAAQPQALDRAVVERAVRDLERAVAVLGRAHREAVVLARHEHAARSALEHRVVRAAMPERQLERLEPERAAEQLVAEADAVERTSLIDHRAHLGDVRVHRAGIAGAVREQHAVGRERVDLGRGGVVRQRP